MKTPQGKLKLDLQTLRGTLRAPSPLISKLGKGQAKLTGPWGPLSRQHGGPNKSAVNNSKLQIRVLWVADTPIKNKRGRKEEREGGEKGGKDGGPRRFQQKAESPY